MADFEQALLLEPENASALIARGNAHFRAERFNEAVTDYDQALLLRPEDPGLRNNRGSAYYELGFYDLAIVDYKGALRQETGFTMLLNLASAYVMLSLQWVGIVS